MNFGTRRKNGILYFIVRRTLSSFFQDSDHATWSLSNHHRGRFSRSQFSFQYANGGVDFVPIHIASFNMPVIFGYIKPFTPVQKSPIVKYENFTYKGRMIIRFIRFIQVKKKLLERRINRRFSYPLSF